MSTERSDFTQGSILKKLSFFMLPVLSALILQAAYGAVDLLVVGQFGSTAGLSAVSTGSQILNLVTFVVTQLAMGVTVLIARYLGEKRPEQIGAILGGAAVVFTILSVGIFILLVGFARPISVLMQAPEEAIDLTASYARICGGGIFFIVAYNLLSAIFRGLGDSRSPLIFVLVACIVNIAGDLLLVAVFGMDAAGAAIATVAAQAVSVVFALVMLKGDVLVGIFSPDAEVVQKGFAYLKGFAPETIVTAVLFSMVGYFNGNDQTLWVMAQGLIQTLLVRLPFAYFMSIQPNASLTKIGLAAPVSTTVGILLNIGFYLYLDRREKGTALPQSIN